MQLYRVETERAVYYVYASTFSEAQSKMLKELAWDDGIARVKIVSIKHFTSNVLV